MNKHTPGPWQVSGVRQDSGAPYKGHMVGPDGDGVVVVPYDAKHHEECLSNARLIAAAPEMAALLQRMEDWLRPEVEKEPDRTFFWEIVELRRKMEGREALFRPSQLPQPAHHE